MILTDENGVVGTLVPRLATVTGLSTHEDRWQTAGKLLHPFVV